MARRTLPLTRNHPYLHHPLMIDSLSPTVAETVHPLLVEISTSPRFGHTRALLEQFDHLLNTLQLAPFEYDRVLLAKRISLLAHKDQEDRPDSQPYVNHPLQVALTLHQKFGVKDQNLLIAALLHDSIEDQAEKILEITGGAPSAEAHVKTAALNQIQAVFGERVRSLVSHLTNPDFDAHAETMIARGDTRSSKEIKRELYKEHFLEIFDNDPYAFMIKLSDFAQNAYTITNVPEEKRSALRAKYGPVIVAVIDRLETLSSSNPLFPFRDSLQRELREVYARDYSA